MRLDAAWAKQWMLQAAADISSARDLLTELDRQIGDGDHGINLDKGFQAVAASLPESPECVGDVLKQVASTVMSTVGGAAGPLYGSAFLRAAKATADCQVLEVDDVIVLLASALEGIQKRGKAARGEKTMVDAWGLAADAAGLEECTDAHLLLQAAAAAADRGSLETIPLIATKGRASYLGERSAGHEDPGARSSAIILAAAAKAAQNSQPQSEEAS